MNVHVTLKGLRYDGSWFEMPPNMMKLNEGLADPLNPFKRMVLTLHIEGNEPAWELVLQRVDSVLWVVEGKGRKVEPRIGWFDLDYREHALLLMVEPGTGG